MKSIFETLAALSAGAVLMTGCGGAPSPVNAVEIPAATEAKPSTGGAVAEPRPSDAAATGNAVASTNAKAASTAAASAPAASGAPMAKPAKAGGKKKTAGAAGANAQCGEGTCA